ncbi:hypothetical protein CCR75_005360 [Bremia lactucae]|uniref:Uncharacterized protein n=1 Tax=Bremia lactucae TaxID=4779 RepID=A0A976ICS4_BRELC|nr:hypothetical protein CCR75_005360 [Bremia lactucae]
MCVYPVTSPPLKIATTVTAAKWSEMQNQKIRQNENRDTHRALAVCPAFENHTRATRRRVAQSAYTASQFDDESRDVQQARLSQDTNTPRLQSHGGR